LHLVEDGHPKPQDDYKVSEEEMKTTRAEEERDLLRSVERGEWRSVPHARRKAETYAAYAEATFRKDKRLNIRISGRDLVKIQKKAVEEGLPYQTLISSVLHKYVGGRLVEKGP
jgi:predicted DNA binding CopG/RHH family protein